MVSLKPDWACALQRKTPENLLAGFDWTLSPVLFAGKTCGIAAIFSDSCSNVARFLCNPDCVAEGEGFEPPVPFPVQWFSSSTAGSEPFAKFSTLLLFSTGYKSVGLIRSAWK
jgi:hypothetical protein